MIRQDMEEEPHSVCDSVNCEERESEKGTSVSALNMRERTKEGHAIHKGHQHDDKFTNSRR